MLEYKKYNYLTLRTLIFVGEEISQATPLDYFLKTIKVNLGFYYSFKMESAAQHEIS